MSLFILNNKKEYNYDISNNIIFDKHRSQELKNILKTKAIILELRISDLENYLQSIQNVVLLISSEYKKLD